MAVRDRAQPLPHDAGRAPRRPVPSELPESGFDDLAEQVRRRAELRELVADLGRLPEEQRAALVLAELGDLSHADIGAVLGCAPQKVKALVFQAREALVADRDARCIPCTQIRGLLETATGGVLRRASLRRHLKQCAPCDAYRLAVSGRRGGLGALLPVAPTAGLKGAVLGAAGLWGGGESASAAVGGRRAPRGVGTRRRRGRHAQGRRGEGRGHRGDRRRRGLGRPRGRRGPRARSRPPRVGCARRAGEAQPSASPAPTARLDDPGRGAGGHHAGTAAARDTNRDAPLRPARPPPGARRTPPSPAGARGTPADAAWHAVCARHAARAGRRSAPRRVRRPSRLRARGPVSRSPPGPHRHPARGVARGPAPPARPARTDRRAHARTDRRAHARGDRRAAAAPAPPSAPGGPARAGRRRRHATHGDSLSTTRRAKPPRSPSGRARDAGPGRGRR